MDYLTLLEEYIATIENVPSDIQHTLFELRTKDEECEVLKRDIGARQTDFYGTMEDIVRAQVRLSTAHANAMLGTTASSTSASPFASQLPPFATTTTTTTTTTTGTLSGARLDPKTNPFASKARFGFGAPGSVSTAALVEAERKELVRDFPDQMAMYKRINGDFDRCKKLAEEKCRIAEQSQALIERYYRRLSEELDRMNPDGEATPTTVGGGSSSKKGTTTPAVSGSLSTPRSIGCPPRRHGTGGYRRDRDSPAFSDNDPTPSSRTAQSSSRKKPLVSTTTTGSALKRPTKRKHVHVGSVSVPTPSRTGANLNLAIPSSSASPSLSPSPSGSGPASPRPRTPASPSDTSDDLLYCLCQQVSFGEMIACDNEDCPHEWFHLECVALEAIPEGSWMCPTCRTTTTATTSITTDSKNVGATKDTGVDLGSGPVVGKVVEKHVSFAPSDETGSGATKKSRLA